MGGKKVVHTWAGVERRKRAWPKMNSTISHLLKKINKT
jgi:hypothetical protein